MGIKQAAPAAEPERINGRVKRVVADRGFGFLTDMNGTEYFFHRTSCEQFERLRDGELVTFVSGASPKGPRAEQVERAID